ncbi:hypothetical protein [Bosea sp. BK604]|uniref:hypothetical protein n=1 Tax=Bosea sp. BK604 TaxID=2512180 RepID=UPI00104C0C2E|nr:hypothetical protein [Bosea sp. BK604]TCR70541.1 hypothetical protein EV560_101948 [Bosea sp. BK604]
MKKILWLILIFVAGVGAAAVLSIVLAWGPAQFFGCGGEKLQISPANGGCVEFWLNRYQQLISGWLSFILASLAAWIIWAQLRTMERQALQNSYERLIGDLSKFDDLLDLGRQLDVLSKFDLAGFEEAITRKDIHKVETEINRALMAGITQPVSNFLRSPVGKPGALPHWRELSRSVKSIEAYFRQLLVLAGDVRAFQPRMLHPGGGFRGTPVPTAEEKAAVADYNRDETAKRWAKLSDFVAATPRTSFSSIEESWKHIEDSLRSQQDETQQRVDRVYPRAHPTE